MFVSAVFLGVFAGVCTAGSFLYVLAVIRSSKIRSRKSWLSAATFFLLSWLVTLLVILLAETRLLPFVNIALFVCALLCMLVSFWKNFVTEA